MRTKTLVLTAVVGAIGIASAAAQTVYSVNAVGYVNKTVPAGGFALLANPLNLATNTLATVLPDLPANTVVYKYDVTTSKFVQSKKCTTGWTPDATLSLKPGEGFFVQNPGTTDVTITFVGEVLTGTQAVSYAAGYNMLGSLIPQTGKIQTDLGLPAKLNDIIYRFDAPTQKYLQDKRRADTNPWTGTTGEPVLNVGDGFFYFNASAAGSWSRTFTIPQ
jgi:hypothetical protein